MFRVLYSKFRHSLGRICLLLLTLLLALLFFNIAFQLYLQTGESIRKIEEKTTTIAFVQSDIEETEFDMQTMSMQKSMRSTAYRRKAESFDSVISNHRGTTRMAWSPALIPSLPDLALQASRPSSMNYLTAPQIGVFRVRVEKIPEPEYEIHNDSGHLEVDGERHTVTGWRAYQSSKVHCTLLETIQLHPNLLPPTDYLIIWCSVLNSDGSFPFEVGKEYVVVSSYIAPSLVKKGSNYVPDYMDGGQNLDIGWDLVYPNAQYAITYPATSGKPAYFTFYDDGTYRSTPVIPDNTPLVLEADDPRVEDMMAWAKRNSLMFPVTGISTVNALPLFAMDKAYIAEGRDIDKIDNTNQNMVCLVSTVFAQQNGLSIGDSITVDMYDHELSVSTDSENNVIYRRLPYLRDWEAKETLTYEIVGIYKTQDFVSSKYHFNTDTVFVPESTIPATMKHDDDKPLNFANSLILQNGNVEQFYAEAAEAGIPDNIFAVNDGGYAQYMKSLRSMEQDTKTILAVSAMLFLVLCIASLGMMTAHLRREAEMMRKVGTGNGYARWYMLLCQLPWVMLAFAASVGISTAMYPRLMKVLEEVYMVVRPRYSSISSAQAGMLTGTAVGIIPLEGAAIAFASSILILIVLCCVHFERRKHA